MTENSTFFQIHIVYNNIVVRNTQADTVDADVQDSIKRPPCGDMTRDYKCSREFQ